MNNTTDSPVNEKENQSIKSITSENHSELVKTIMQIQSLPEEVVVAFLNAQGSFITGEEVNEKQD